MKSEKQMRLARVYPDIGTPPYWVHMNAHDRVAVDEEVPCKVELWSLTDSEVAQMLNGQAPNRQCIVDAAIKWIGCEDVVFTRVVTP